MVQDFTARPFISTVHAPQYVVSQPTCVPVRSQSSRRNSTSSTRGSISRAYDLPFTLIWTAIFFVAAVSGIEMCPLHLLAASAAGRDFDGAFHEGRNQFTFVIGRPAHVRMW